MGPFDPSQAAILSTHLLCLIPDPVTVHRTGKPNKFGEGVVAEVAKTFGRYQSKTETLGEFRYQLVNGYLDPPLN